MKWNLSGIKPNIGTLLSRAKSITTERSLNFKELGPLRWKLFYDTEKSVILKTVKVFLVNKIFEKFPWANRKKLQLQTLVILLETIVLSDTNIYVPLKNINRKKNKDILSVVYLFVNGLAVFTHFVCIRIKLDVFAGRFVDGDMID